MTELECPKCHTPMRHYERSGLVIDQCTGCRGVFLDRGELDRLVDAEGAYYEREERERERRPDRDDRFDDDREYLERGGRPERPYGGLEDLLRAAGSQRGGGRHRRKQRGLLGELFD